MLAGGAGSRAWPFWAALPCALALVVWAHFPGLAGGFTNWDDPTYLLENPQTEDPLVRGPGALLTTDNLGYPIPVTVLGYAAQRAAFGLDPLAFHLISLLLHAGVVLLAAALARRLGASWAAAALAAALFGVHPLGAEPVAWVVGQKDLLAALFLLAALVVRAGPRGESAGATAATALLTVLALGAKPTVIGAPLMLGALDVALGRSLCQRRSTELYGVTALAAVAVGVGGLLGHGYVGGEAPRQLSADSLLEAGWGCALQAGHIFWPSPLLARYFPPPGAGLPLAAAAGTLLALAAGAAAVWAWRRGARMTAWSAAAALVAYAPVCGLVPLTRGPADSYLYLPLALLCPAAALGLDRALFARERRTAAAAIAAALALALLLVLGLRARAESADWHSSLSLWSDVAAEYPEQPGARMRVADAHFHGGEVGEALALYERLRTDFPAYAPPRVAHGLALEVSGRTGEADELLAEGVRLGGERAYREEYAFFLTRHPELFPRDREAARTALLELAPLLAERGKRAPTVRRAMELLRALGEEEMAERLGKRLAKLVTE